MLCAAAVAALLAGCGPTEALDAGIERAPLPVVFGSVQEASDQDSFGFDDAPEDSEVSQP